MLWLADTQLADSQTRNIADLSIIEQDLSFQIVEQ
jgi:hypothetical protein